MKFSYNFLKKYVDIKLSPEKLAELLTLHSFETEVFQKSGKNAILDVDILPNRSHDIISHYGLAKEIAALTGKFIKTLTTAFLADPKTKTKNFVFVDVLEKNLCPRYIAKILTDVKIQSSPKWLQNELLRFNVNPHNNIVDSLNYVMLETGQPMHAFDFDKLQGRKIIVRRAEKGETINTLDGGQYNLSENILVIADGKNPAAIAGIKGGFQTGISEKTNTIVIESANFNPAGIRKTSRALNLITDAAIRFSAGIDPNLAEIGLNRACSLIQEISPEVKIASDVIDVYKNKCFPVKIKLRLGYVNKMIGEIIKPQFVKKTLESLGMAVKKTADGDALLVAVPTIRLDLKTEEDLIEEVARFYGLMNLKGALPKTSAAASKEDDLNIFAKKAGDILIGIGFNEARNYSFIADKDPDEEEKKNLAEIENPISAEFKYLRPNLLFNLLKNVKNNFRFLGRVKFFEIGKVFLDSGKISEKVNLTGICAVKEHRENISGEKFFELKGNLDELLKSLGIADYNYAPMDLGGKWWHPGRAARVEYNGGILGEIGEINPAILELLDISGRIVAFSLDFEKIALIAEEEREFTPVSKYPAVIRDISVLVDRSTRVSEVLDIIYGAGAKLIEDVDLFDYYDGDELPDGRKSLSFHIIYQADRTLLDEEVKREEEKIRKALIEKLNAEIR